MELMDSILEKCKQKAKLVMEFSTTCKHIHWTHTSVVDFCVSVENALSYGAKKSGKKLGRKYHPASLRILASLSQTNPLCADVFNRCYPKSPPKSVDHSKAYLLYDEASPLEYSILWIRACLVEKRLVEIVQVFIDNAQIYYLNESVLASEVHADILSFLLIGPCSIRLSILRPVDTPTTTPASELVERMRVISSQRSGLIIQDDKQPASVNTPLWEHMESLFQHVNSTCLFGKNNTIIIEHGREKSGYLSIHQDQSDVVLKWIPSILLTTEQAVYVNKSELKDLCLSINISQEIAHVHCHKNDDRAQLLMIGYDGIAKCALVFQQHMSVVTFLECLENGLMPKGCLQPPLFYLKNCRKPKHNTNKSESVLLGRQGSISLRHSTSDSRLDKMSTDNYHLAEFTKSSHDANSLTDYIWNQVFTIRYGSQPVVKDTPATLVGSGTSILTGGNPACRVIMPTPDQFDKTTCTGVNDDGVMSPGVGWAENTHYEQNRKDLQQVLLKKQKEISKSLLANHFYSWLSYCRHHCTLRKQISHMLLADPLPQPKGYCSVLTEEVLQTLTDEEGRVTNWAGFLSCIYNGGMEELLRPKIWPVLLGVYPYDSSYDEKTTIDQENKLKYETLLQEGKKIEGETKVIQKQRQKSEAKLFKEMMDALKTTNKTETTSKELTSCAVANDSNTNTQPEIHTDPRSDRYMEELEIIDKDVSRCDRNYEYFMNKDNLSKLRNVVSCYCLDNLKPDSVFYVQGMCDLLAPLLVIFHEEAIAFSCFAKMMDQLMENFPPSEGIQKKQYNITNLTQVFEPDFFDSLQQPDFLFCRKWFLLAFKREFAYKEIFRLWETMWAANYCITNCFMEFFAFSLLRKYIPIIMHSNMDSVEMLILFGEMESREHDGEFGIILSSTMSLINNILQSLHNV